MTTGIASKKQGSRKSKKAKDAGAEKEERDFQWTDDESDRLLNLTYDYKVTKAATSVD